MPLVGDKGLYSCTQTHTYKCINHNIFHTVFSLKGILEIYLPLTVCAQENYQLGSSFIWFHPGKARSWRPGATCHAGEKPGNWGKFSKDLHFKGVHGGYQNWLWIYSFQTRLIIKILLLWLLDSTPNLLNQDLQEMILGICRFFCFCFLLFIYLAAPGINCSIQDLCCSLWDIFVCLFHCSTWDLVPWPAIEPGAGTMGAWNLSHWTTREVPRNLFNRLSRCF